MSVKNAILKTLIEGAIVDLFVKTGVEIVVIIEDEQEKTLASKLTEIISSLNLKATTEALTSGLASKAEKVHSHSQSDIEGLDTALTSRPTTETMNSAISKAISDLIGGAPETYDTLKEIADYIAEHETVVEALNAAIGAKLDKSVYDAFIATLGSLATKSKVSESDLDSALAEKVNSASIETIKVNGVIQQPVDKSVDIKVPAIYAQETQPANLKEGDLFFQIIE